MYKTTIFSSAIVLSFGLSVLFTQLANAEEGIMPISENETTPTSDEQPIEGVINPDDIDDSNEPTDIIDTNTTVDTSNNNETSSDLEDDLIHNGTSDEAEVVCADPNERGCEDEAVNPEMWPLYLSLGALGATILFIIIINLVGGHRKK